MTMLCPKSDATKESGRGKIHSVMLKLQEVNGSLYVSNSTADNVEFFRLSSDRRYPKTRSTDASFSRKIHTGKLNGRKNFRQ